MARCSPLSMLSDSFPTALRNNANRACRISPAKCSLIVSSSLSKYSATRKSGTLPAKRSRACFRSIRLGFQLGRPPRFLAGTGMGGTFFRGALVRLDMCGAEKPIYRSEVSGLGRCGCRCQFRLTGGTRGARWSTPLLPRLLVIFWCRRAALQPSLVVRVTETVRGVAELAHRGLKGVAGHGEILAGSSINRQFAFRRKSADREIPLWREDGKVPPRAPRGLVKRRRLAGFFSPGHCPPDPSPGGSPKEPGDSDSGDGGLAGQIEMRCPVEGWLRAVDL